MTHRAQPDPATKAKCWAQRLSRRVEKVMAAYPEVDRDNVRHTLILLELPPLERLRRSLIRGGAANRLHKTRNRC